MADAIPFDFYLPEDADNTIVQSALDAVRYLLQVSDRDEAGHLRCRSIDAGPDGELVRYRGRLIDGVGYCADSIFGSHVLVRLGRALKRPELETAGFSYLNHALTSGFFDDPDLPVRLYLDTEAGRFIDNLEQDEAYLEPGHMARVGTQLLRISSLDQDETRAVQCRSIAVRIAEWIRSIERCANGWYPRRCTPSGEPFPFAANAFGPTKLADLSRPDPIYDKSGSGALALELLASTTQAGILDASGELRRDVDAFVGAGGYFGSTNSDTEDLHENVSYALTFQAIRQTSQVLDDPTLRDFAYERCLAPLERFELKRNLNGLATKGLLYMEDSWNAACTWEMAEAAQAYLIAFGDHSRLPHVIKALTIMRGMAMHHHGQYGFLTEAVDWDGHSTSLRHFPGERYGDIATTHPFLNNLHVVQPTATFLERFAVQGVAGDVSALYDVEGNRLCDLPVGVQDWMHG